MGLSLYDRIRTYQTRRDHLLIGLMSGTSLDGIDAALVKVSTNADLAIESVSLEGFTYLPYTESLKSLILELCSIETARIDQLVRANAGLSEWYALTVKQLLEETKVTAEDIDAVCSHGQTIWHAPEKASFPGPDAEMTVQSTLQIGDLSTLVERTNIPVVGNFRTRDLAAGGEGAPLVPYADYILFGDSNKNRILQNIGGIGNATVLTAGASLEEVVAFDTGPGNIVIDGLMQIESQGRLSYDDGGKQAALGSVNQELLDAYLQDTYYDRRPPKSTGREVYGRNFTKRFLEDGKNKGLSFSDIIATATALTAKTITKAYKDFILPSVKVHEVILSGGGAHNQTLMQMIKQDLPPEISLKTAKDFGVPDDAKEAMAFAVLGHETLMGRPSNVPSVTGAKKPVVLGNVCW
ncbi:anhydro-N-acetylmuramic acid kinase [Camelliibacillus cellulosilyticus]|uniref:Anhydro-N-acetylmuramic acid kinase n=1 Tax=Camelliibacillus cellulosilyticus TaxID=2174486 RepID=A0ABV9GQL2_9BACL